MRGWKKMDKQEPPCKHDGFVYKTTSSTVKDNDGVYCKLCGDQIK